MKYATEKRKMNLQQADGKGVPDANIIQLLLPADLGEVIWKQKKYDLF